MPRGGEMRREGGSLVADTGSTRTRSVRRLRLLLRLLRRTRARPPPPPGARRRRARPRSSAPATRNATSPPVRLPPPGAVRAPPPASAPAQASAVARPRAPRVDRRADQLADQPRRRRSGYIADTRGTWWADAAARSTNGTQPFDETRGRRRAGTTTPTPTRRSIPRTNSR